MMHEDEIDQAKETYLNEMQELLQKIEENLLEFREKGESETINSLFRAFHTIKGTSEMFGYGGITRFAHSIENLLDAVRKGDEHISEDMIPVLLQSGDHINELLHEELSPAEIQEKEGEILRTLFKNRIPSKVATISPGAKEENSSPVSDMEIDYSIHLQFKPDIFRHGMDPYSFLRYLQKLGTIKDLVYDVAALPSIEEFNPESSYGGVEILFQSKASRDEIIDNFDFLQDDCDILVSALEQEEHDTREPIDETKHEESANGHKKETGARSQNRSFRVDAERIDRLINLVSELIISGAHIGQIGSTHNNQEMMEASYHLGRIISDIQENTMRLRMVPVSGVFQRFKRVIYDIARELEKSVELETLGGDTELDRSIIEKISDPLMHLIRNAVDHGIEDPATREKNGKQRTGRILLNAFTEAGDIVIEISDDGKGIDRKRVLDQAIRMGLINAGHGLSDYETDRLILQAGFSTAKEITNLSGRGVGLDVVSRNVEELRGTLEVRSREGQGTTFKIKLPLSLATLEGFLVRIGETYYVISLDIVLECIEYKKHASSGERNIINLRGEILPFMDLREIFHDENRSEEVRNIVIVKYNDRKAGLVVDELLGEVQSVIKPMGKILGKVKGINGSTILGNGEVALILDVPSLLQFIESREEKYAGIKG